MRVLAIDTTSPPGSLALWEDGRIQCERLLQGDRPFGESLPGAALAVLAEAGWALKQLDLFVVGRGPGSLTGLRVGIATAQGFAFASNRPLAGVSALEAAAASVQPPPGGDGHRMVAAWMDARRAEVFAQLFERQVDGALRPIDGPVVGAPADIGRRWIDSAGGLALDVVGTAAAATAAAWTDAQGLLRARLLEAPPLAGTMARLGAALAAAGNAGPPHAVVPLYVRRPDAELARERKRQQAVQAEGGRER